MTTRKRKIKLLLTCFFMCIALIATQTVATAATKTAKAKTTASIKKMSSKKKDTKKKKKKKKKKKSKSKKKGKKVTFRATAYCPCYSCSGGYGHSTASGARATEYHTVAASRSYPMGTKIYIPYFKKCKNKGWFVVQDRGGAIGSGRLDIFFESHAKTNQFGVRKLTAYVYYP